MCTRLQVTLARKGVLQICKVLGTVVNTAIKTSITVVEADIKMFISFTVTILICEEINL